MVNDLLFVNKFSHCTKLETGNAIQYDAYMLPYYFVFTVLRIVYTILVPS